MLTILNLALAILFVLLLLSPLTMLVMEMVAAVFSMRSRHLHRTLRAMLGGLAHDFLKHPFLKQLARPTRSAVNGLPARMNKAVFTAILFDVLRIEPTASDVRARIQAVEDDHLKDILQYLYRQSENGGTGAFRQKIEYWFEQVMEIATDQYRRSIRWWLFGIGFALALLLNIDALQVIQRLWSEGVGEVFIETGWHSIQSGNWLMKMAGWILSAAVAAWGAVFWFDWFNPQHKLKEPSEKPTETIVEPAAQSHAETENKEVIQAGTSLEPILNTNSEIRLFDLFQAADSQKITPENLPTLDGNNIQSPQEGDVLTKEKEVYRDIPQKPRPVNPVG